MLIPEGDYTITPIPAAEKCHRIDGPGGFQAIVWGRGGSQGYVLRKFLEEFFEGYAELHQPETQTFTVRCA
jgi:hypothetical protein